MTAPTPTGICPSRRALLQGVLATGGIALLPGALTACSSPAGTTVASSTAAAIQGATVPTAQVPVGTAIVTTINQAPIVLAQPEAGRYVAFLAICTHKGATVAAQDGLIVRCPAHGSEFDASQGGKATERPATDPLPEITVAVEGDNLVLQ